MKIKCRELGLDSDEDVSELLAAADDEQGEPEYDGEPRGSEEVEEERRLYHRRIPPRTFLSRKGPCVVLCFMVSDRTSRPRSAV